MNNKCYKNIMYTVSIFANVVMLMLMNKCCQCDFFNTQNDITQHKIKKWIFYINGLIVHNIEHVILTTNITANQARIW